MAVPNNRKRNLRLQSKIFTLLFLAVIGCLAWLSTQHVIVSDWTYGQRNSLSTASVELLKAMPDDIIVNVYLPEASSLRAAITELLKRYQQQKKNFKFKILNPDIDIDLAKAENISRYGQVTVRYANKKETLDNINESLLGNALSRLSRDKTPHVVFIEGHGEHQALDTGNAGYSQFSRALQDKGIKVSSHHLLSGPLPADTTIVVIAGATKAYLPGESERLVEYIKVGGQLLWLQDPDTDTALSALAEQLEIKFGQGIIVDADPNLRATLRIEHPATIAVLQYNLHAITNKIPYNTLFMMAGSVDSSQSENPQWDNTTLFSSRESTWAETGTLLTDSIEFNTETGDTLGPLPIAIALERNAPFSPPPQQKQRVVVVADSDFLNNSYIGAGANLLLAQNIINWLSQDEQLLAFEIKSAPDLQLQLSDTQVTMIGLGFLVVLPAGLLLVGLLIWRKRKRS